MTLGTEVEEEEEEEEEGRYLQFLLRVSNAEGEKGYRFLCSE